MLATLRGDLRDRRTVQQLGVSLALVDPVLAPRVAPHTIELGPHAIAPLGIGVDVGPLRSWRGEDLVEALCHRERERIFQSDLEHEWTAGNLRPHLSPECSLLVECLLRPSGRLAQRQQCSPCGRPADLLRQRSELFHVEPGTDRRLEHAAALVPHCGCQSRDLVDVGQPAGHRLAGVARVRRRLRRGEPDGAGLDGFTDERPHRVDLVVGRLAFGGRRAEDVQPQRGVPDHRRHIQTLVDAVECVEIFGEGLERPVDPGFECLDRHALDVLKRAGDHTPMLGACRRNREAAVAHHDRRDAVPARRRQIAVPRHLRVVVGVDVDETRRQHEAVEVDDLRAAGGVDVTDGDDAIALHRHVGRARGRPGAVDDLAAPKYEVHGSPYSSNVLSRRYPLNPDAAE